MMLAKFPLNRWPTVFFMTLFVAMMSMSGSTSAADPSVLKISHPQPNQVLQRTGIAPRTGYAQVVVRGEVPAGAESAIWEYRVTPVGVAQETGWSSLPAQIQDGTFEGQARIAAGWFRLEVRSRVGDAVVSHGSVEPCGVGEVFLVAGQSYATNCNDELLSVTDEQQRVVAYDCAKGTWRAANDPQPVADGSDGGSIWPPLGDALAKELGVPVAFANVAWGGTSSQQWMPEGDLHKRLVQVGQTLGRFRAVLWQQGESDVIAKTTAETYISNILAIRTTAADAWDFEPPWLLAKSTLHPTVYNDPEGEGRIRGAIDSLSQLKGFRPGPDTDTLKVENRGDATTRRHFSGVGQKNAAQMWQAAILLEVLPRH